MFNIFIDTNIYLDLYRSNMSNDISLLMNFIFKNKKYLIGTEQSFNEFVRNRSSILENVFDSFQKETQLAKASSNFLRSLKSYNKYAEAVNKCSEQRQNVLNEIKEKIDNLNEDTIYIEFCKLYKPANMISRSDEVINRAYKRKISGDPPTSDKYTCGDEIIWESLLEYEKEKRNNLIIVTNDKTYFKNEEFLAIEYKKKTGALLTICNSIVDAYRLVGVGIAEAVLQANENVKWTDIIITALVNLGGQATLAEIYNEANDILYYNDCYEKINNKAKESTIRGVLQRFSSDCASSFNGKKDLFHLVRDGVWALR